MVTRSKAYHTEEAIHNSVKYVENEEKTDLKVVGTETGDIPSLFSAVEGELEPEIMRAFNYAANPRKTKLNDSSEDVLVAGHLCKPDEIEAVFRDCRDAYYASGKTEVLKPARAKRLFRAAVDSNGNVILDKDGQMIYDEDAPVYHDPTTGKTVYQFYMKQKQARTGYMWVLSFPGKNEIGYDPDPRLVMALAKEWCREFLGEEFPALIAVHLPGAAGASHIHVHIVQCAYSLPSPDMEPHKYIDNSASIARAREISDKISLRAGIPIIENPKSKKGISWYEWRQKMSGESWKETMREDIKTAVSLSRDMDEFKHIMETSGYRLRETAHHFTFYMPCASEDAENYCCRDSRLGVSDEAFDYTKDGIASAIEGRLKAREKALEEVRENEPEQEAGKKQEKKKTEELPFHTVIDPAAEEKRVQHKDHYKIGRYTIDGRRRGTLEMILLNAIRLILIFRDSFQTKEPVTKSPVYQKAAWKHQQMKETLAIIKSLEIESKDDLTQKINSAGIELSRLKKQASQFEAIKGTEETTLQKIEEAIRMQQGMKSLGINKSDLFLHIYKENEIAQKRAELSPSTADQKRDLYTALEGSAYRIDNIDNMTYQDAAQALNFLAGRSSIKPDCLTSMLETSADNMKRKYDSIAESRLQAMKTKYDKKPATEGQIKAVTRILTNPPEQMKPYQHMFGSIYPDKLTFFDASRLIAFSQTNSFSGKVIDDSQRGELISLVHKNGGKLNRNAMFITVGEYESIKRFYTGGKKRNVPDLIAPGAEKAPDAKIAAVSRLLEIRGEEISMPVEILTEKEIDKLYSYLLMKETVPEILTGTMEEKRKAQDMDFLKAMANRPLAEAQQIDRYRTLLNELAAIGIQPSALIEAKHGIEQTMQAYQVSREKLKEAGDRYRTLKRVEYNIALAINPKFTNGPLYDTTKDEKVTEITDDKMELEEDRETERQKDYKEEDQYFNSTIRKKGREGR